MSEILKACHDHLQLARLHRLLRLPRLHQCLRRRLSYEKKVSRAQGDMKEQAAKERVTEVRAKVDTED